MWHQLVFAIVVALASCQVIADRVDDLAELEGLGPEF